MAIQVGNNQADDDVIIDINTTPLIDVMLVLLIMFIITIPIQTHAVKMNMPRPSEVVPPKPPEIVRIDVQADGQVGWISSGAWPKWRRCPIRPNSTFGPMAA